MKAGRTAAAGLAGGLAGNAILGLAFSSAPLQALLYDPALQSALFIEVARGRDIPTSVAGLVILSIVHAWLYGLLAPSMPGAGRIAKGLFWGLAIWLMYWVFQEWFIYKTLLHEPWPLVAVELAVLLAGSLVEGLVIAGLMPHRQQDS
jgi:hypothetical protein